MPKNSFLKALFPGIKYSLSPIDKRVKGTAKIGQVLPVYWTMLNGKESVELDLGHLVRFLPTNVPVMEGYKVTFDAFAVSLSALAYAERKERNVIDFHNLALNGGEDVNPFVKSPDVVDFRGYGSFNDSANGNHIHNAFRPGSIGDFVNLPSFKHFRDFIRAWIAKTPLFDGSLSSRFVSVAGYDDDGRFIDVSDFIARYLVGSFYDIIGDNQVNMDGTGRGHGYRQYVLTVPFDLSGKLIYPKNHDSWYSYVTDGVRVAGYNLRHNDESVLADINVNVRSLLRYVCDLYPEVADYYGLSSVSTLSDVLTALNSLYGRASSEVLNLNYLEVLYNLYRVDAQSVFNDWFENEVVKYFLYNPELLIWEANSNSWDLVGTFYDEGYLPALEDFDFSPIAAYWKIISDWYINTNIDGNPDDFYISNCRLFNPYNPGSDYDGFEYFVNMQPFNRRWRNDIFTSAVPSSANDDIKIPVDGTIPQFREANAYQRIKDILRNVGNRAKDVMYGIRGYTPTAQASEMSIPVGSLSSYVGIQSVLQTSQTTIDSAQASYSGIGTDSSHGNFRRILKVINNSEPVPVIVMVLMSVTQESTYMQGFDRRFFRKSIYDFAVPELANVGEDAVYSKELFFDYSEDGESVTANEIFGFNRRYYSWFVESNEIHGDMRDLQDIWHGARIFDSKPALNSEFIQIDSSRDHLGRVFANISEESYPILFNLSFEGHKIVSLPRYIQYEL